MLSVRSARAADDPLMLSASLATTAPVAGPTQSQANTHQFNQLFQFQTTPNVCAAGEGYVSGQVTYLNDLEGAGGTGQFVQYSQSSVDVYQASFSGRQARFQVQGEYGITDQLALGAYVPVVYSPDTLQDQVTTGDVGIYAQYKLDPLIPHRIVDVTLQVDLVLPTGYADALGDAGRLGAGLAVLAYKDFGKLGPGVLGAYAFVDYTARRHPSVASGLAVTYEFPNGLAAVAEVTGAAASDFDGVELFTPGVIYRGLRPFEFALGIPLGIRRASPDWGVDFKVTYAFAR